MSKLQLWLLSHRGQSTDMFCGEVKCMEGQVGEGCEVGDGT